MPGLLYFTNPSMQSGHHEPQGELFCLDIL